MTVTAEPALELDVPALDLDVPALDLDVTAQTNPPGIRLRGEIDVSTLPILELALELLADVPGDVIIDLHLLTFIDVPGSRALAGAAIRFRENGRRMRLDGASPQIRRVLGVLGWTTLFDFPLTVAGAPAPPVAEMRIPHL
jgi:anti-anti-sigma factor